MKEQLRRGKVKYISFIVLDLACLIIASALSIRFYLSNSRVRYSQTDYTMIIGYMIIIDILVISFGNTLNKVLRRKIGREIIESVKHVAICFLLLALYLFSTKQGAEYSRATIYFAYSGYLALIILQRSMLKLILNRTQTRKAKATALLITTSGYVNEGLSIVENADIEVKGLFITDKTNEGRINDIPVLVGRKDAAAFLCWEWIDRVYICGPDSIDVPEALLTSCKQMDIQVFTAPSRKSFEYEVIKIRTALQKDDKDTGLSFFEAERDIPFRISRLYTIYGSEQEKQRGFHAHKQSWHLLFCPYGSIDILIDTGKERRTVSLSDPSIGLILHPSIWREMYWKKVGSVLCVATSGHYDAETLKNDYNAYQKFLQEKEWYAVIESEEILGEAM